MKKLPILIISLLFILSASLFILNQKGIFSIIGDESGDESVWIPSYGSISCERTRLACYPEVNCNIDNSTFHTIDENGESFWCGSPTLSNADYFTGCDVYIQGGGFFDLSKIQICEGDGTNCRNTNLADTTIWGYKWKTLHLKANEKVYVNPNIASYKIRMLADVWGIKVQGEVKPQYSDYCNLASLLKDGQISIFKNDQDYPLLLKENTISPGQYPRVFIIGYKQSYKDTRILERDNKIFFVEDVGSLCEVERDTNNRLIVTDKCKEDNTIQCIPGIGFCDKDGKITTSENQACVPGTLITSRRNAISDTRACSQRCNSEGKIENFNCITIQDCKEGEVLNSDYDCVERLILDEKALCESQGNRWVEKEIKECNFWCDLGFTSPDITTEAYCKKPFNYWIVLIPLFTILLLLGIYFITKKR